MDRKAELIKCICKKEEDKVILQPLIEELLFLEGRLDELKKLPFIQIHPSDPARQKNTTAQKQYRELLQQYTNIIKVLERNLQKDGGEEDSPLRKWAKERYVH